MSRYKIFSEMAYEFLREVVATLWSPHDCLSSFSVSSIALISNLCLCTRMRGGGAKKPEVFKHKTYF